MTKNDKQYVCLKNNQLALHHEEYDIDFLVEIDFNAKDGRIEMNFLFDESKKQLTSEQKQKIADEFTEEIKNVFADFLD